MDEESIKKEGLKPLLEIVYHVKELFPISVASEDVRVRDERLQTAILYLYELGITAIIAPFTSADDKNPDAVVVAVMPPQRIGLPAKELYEDENIVGKYKSVVSEVFAGLFTNSLHAEVIGDDVVEFEKKLAAAAPREEDANDVTKYYNPMSLEEASDLLPQAGLAAIVRKLAPKDVKVEGVINMSPSYMNKTALTLKDTDDKVLQNYLIWKVVQSLYPYVEADALTPYKRFANELQGKDPDSAPERWRTCVRHVDDGLGWILSRFFVEKAFSAKAKEFGDQMVTDIKTEFIKKLQATKWMEKKVIDKAIDKVHNIIQKIGYPTKSPDIMDPSALQKYYDSVSVSPSAYFANALAMDKLEIGNMWSALGKPVDREKWDMSVPTVNACKSTVPRQWIRSQNPGLPVRFWR
jgi:endothelin-converting enzyme